MRPPLHQTAELNHDGFHRCPTRGGRTVDCRVRVIESRWHTVIIVSDLNADIISSITLHTEELARMIATAFCVESARLVWIEHIPADSLRGRTEDLYDLVHFEEMANGSYSTPFWTPLSNEEVELLTGGLVHPHYCEHD